MIKKKEKKEDTIKKVIEDDLVNKNMENDINLGSGEAVKYVKHETILADFGRRLIKKKKGK